MSYVYIYIPNRLYVAQLQKKLNEKFQVNSKVDWSQILFKSSNIEFFS